MKIRSGYKQTKKKNRSRKAFLELIKRKSKKLLSFNLFSLNFIKRFSKKKPHVSKTYLSKDIWKKSFDNPYRKKRRFPSSIFDFLSLQRYAIAQVILIVTILVWFVVIFVQPTFYITKTNVKGTKEIQKGDLLSLIDEHFSKRSIFLVKKSHLFFLDLENLEDKIREKYGLESISFTPHWTAHSIDIELVEKVSVLAYSANDNYYTIDRQGMIIRQIESFEEIQEDEGIPIIYQYSPPTEVQVGSFILTPSNIETILRIQAELKKYQTFSVHSFRFKDLAKSEVRITSDVPMSDVEEIEEDEEVSDDLDKLAETIANAGTLDEKISTLKRTLENLDIERIEEGGGETLYDSQSIYLPNDDFQIQELEVYMDQGWALKLGHDILKDQSLVNSYLSIFATLSGNVDIAGEIKEYVDLRFPGRIYYR